MTYSPGQARIGIRPYTQSYISYLLSSAAAALSTPILDTYSGSGAAYSLRKLKTTYSGYAIKVRRSSDNTETDIGFSGEALDTVSLLAFVGSGNGFVTTWYDQSGNGKNAVQTTATNQPNIVTGGSIRTQGTKPTLYFDGVDDFLDCGYLNNGTKPSNFSTWISANLTDISQTRSIFASGNNTGEGKTGYNQFYIHQSYGYKMLGSAGDNTNYKYWATSTVTPTNQRYLFEQHYVSNSATASYLGQFWWNDTRQSVTTISGGGTAQQSSGIEFKTSIGRLGEWTGFYFQGMMQEIVTYPSDKTSVRKEIVANINSYYSIYTQDTNPLTAAAYSLRKLTADYTGSAIRVRRSGDNTEQNIGFKSDGSLDENTLTTFAESPNSFLYSQDFDNAYWTKNAVTITANQGIAPDGTQTADLLQENVGNAYHYLTQKTINGFNVGDSWNMSFYAKKSPTNTGSNKIMMRQWTNDYSDGGSTAVFNLETGQVVHTTDGTYQGGTFGILGATMSNEGNGWWRCSMYGKRLASTWGSQTTDYSIAIGRVATLTMWSETIVGAPVYAQKWPGDTTASYYIWGVQLTKKNDESYQAIKTYTKTTTSYPGSAYVTTWYDQSGNSRNLAQATAINQPPIIELGTIVKVNGKPNLSFLFSSTTRRWLGMTWGTTTINPPFSIFLSMKISQLYDFNILTGLEANKRFGMYIGKYTFWAADNNYMFGDVANTNSSIHYIYTSAAENSKLGKNGSTNSTFITPGSWRAIQLGMSDTGQFYASELIFFYGDKSASRATIESNMNTYYSAY